MAFVYSLDKLEKMQEESLELFKEVSLLDLTADDSRGFVKVLKVNESDLFCSIMEDIRERYLEIYCEEAVSDISVLSDSSRIVRADRVLDYFDQATIGVVTRFIENKLHDYGVE